MMEFVGSGLERPTPREKVPEARFEAGPGVGAPDKRIIPQVEADSSGWPSIPGPFMRAESSNRKSLRPGNRGFPGNGLLVDVAWTDVRGAAGKDPQLEALTGNAPSRRCGAESLAQPESSPATPYASLSPRRPGPKATQVTEGSYKAPASQAGRVAHVAATAERSHGMRCA